MLHTILDKRVCDLAERQELSLAPSCLTIAGRLLGTLRRTRLVQRLDRCRWERPRLPVDVNDQLLGGRLQHVVQVSCVPNQVEAEVAVDPFGSQRLVNLKMSEGRFHSEDDVFVPLTTLRLDVVALMRLVKDKEPLQIVPLAFADQHLPKQLAQFLLRHVCRLQPSLALAIRKLRWILRRAWPHKLAARSSLRDSCRLFFRRGVAFHVAHLGRLPGRIKIRNAKANANTHMSTHLESLQLWGGYD